MNSSFITSRPEVEIHVTNFCCAVLLTSINPSHMLIALLLELHYYKKKKKLNNLETDFKKVNSHRILK